MEEKLKLGNIYKNSDLYNIFKCGNSGGMRKSNSTNSLLIIADHTKSLYDDKWDNEVLYYTGMGQVGDQDINYMQNKTLNESNKNGITLFLFEVFIEREYIYRGRLKLIEKPFREEQLDKNGNLRYVWVFPLKLIDEERPIEIEMLKKIEEKRSQKIKKLSNEELKRGAQQGRKNPGKRKSLIINYNRNQYVIEYAKRIAAGKCQLCGNKAPFKNKKGEPYLEVHHINPLAQGGEDTLKNVVALCPNCHRKMHSLNLEKDKITLLKKAKRSV